MAFLIPVEMLLVADITQKGQEVFIALSKVGKFASLPLVS